MATVFTLRCTNGPDSADLKISDNFGPDSWEGVGGAAVWGADASGALLKNGTSIFLTTGGGSLMHVIDGFSASITVGRTGTGSKAPNGGSFPDGDFDWRCTRID